MHVLIILRLKLVPSSMRLVEMVMPGQAHLLCHSRAQDTGFFCRWNGQWDSPYGRFFLEWYSDALIQHARSLLRAATSIFHSRGNPRCNLDNHNQPFTSAVHADYGVNHSNLGSVSHAQPHLRGRLHSGFETAAQATV